MEKSTQKERTRRRLKKAFIRVASEKDYYAITIDDICGEAETYRSTFYRYYTSKDDLLREIENEYVEYTRSLTPSFLNVASSDMEENQKNFRKELVKDMQYHWEHRELCKVLLSPGGDLYFHDKMISSLEKTFISQVNLPRKKKKNLQSAADFFAAGFLSSVYEWLKREDRTPEEMADFLLFIIMDFRKMFVQ